VARARWTKARGKWRIDKTPVPKSPLTGQDLIYGGNFQPLPSHASAHSLQLMVTIIETGVGTIAVPYYTKINSCYTEPDTTGWASR
jgi:hypothetical protein